VLELIDLWQQSSDEHEKLEIQEALDEICFPRPEDAIATPIEEEKSKDNQKALLKHRQYVGEQIKRRRQELKMTQEELATKAAIPQSHVCRLETGKHAPTYVTIQKVAKALRVKRSQLDPGFDD